MILSLSPCNGQVLVRQKLGVWSFFQAFFMGADVQEPVLSSVAFPGSLQGAGLEVT